MPIYEFACLSCGRHFDRLQKLSEQDPTSCPNCGAPTPARQISPSTIRFKGTGFYETDFKPKSEQHNVVRPDPSPSKKG